MDKPRAVEAEGGRREGFIGIEVLGNDVRFIDNRRDLLETLLDMHNTREGQRVLSILNIDRFVLPEDSLYDGVRFAARIAESLE